MILCCIPSVAPGDYGSLNGQVLQFNKNDERICYTIDVNDDDICENMPNENFFSNLAYDTGVQPITVVRDRAEVIIDDSLQPECRKCLEKFILCSIKCNSYFVMQGLIA